MARFLHPLPKACTQHCLLSNIKHLNLTFNISSPYTFVYSCYYIYTVMLISREKIKTFQSTSCKDVLCQVWLILAHLFWRRFSNFVNVFLLHVFRYYLPLRKGLLLYFKNLNSLYSRMLCAKFDRNWPNGSGEEDKSVNSLQQK